MKLYAFQPNGHGQLSFFVMAQSTDEAFEAVDKHIRTEYTRNGVYTFEADGWGTDYYVLTVVDSGIVIENDNS